MININDIEVGDVILADFPYENMADQVKLRPAVVIAESGNVYTVIALKITSSPPRDVFDYELVDWALEGLNKPSIVRTSKEAIIPIHAIFKKIGTLTPNDFKAVKELYVSLTSAK